MKDLTNDNAAWRVKVDKAHYIDLCSERCAPVFEKFDAERRRLALDSRDELRSDIDELVTKFWEDLGGGTKEKEG